MASLVLLSDLPVGLESEIRNLGLLETMAEYV